MITEDSIASITLQQ